MVLDNYKQHAIGYLIPVVVFGSLGVMVHAIRKGLDKLGLRRPPLFTSLECWWGAAFALYPVVLPASTNPAYNLTITIPPPTRHGLNVGITWWIIAMVLALDISLSWFRMFRGR